jgi:hypothetical protein
MTLNPTNVNITTAGAHSLTTAEVLAGFISRTGPTGDFEDTLPATDDLLSAIGAQTPFIVEYMNASDHTATIVAGDANTTVARGAGTLGASTIATQQKCQILFTPSNSTLLVTLLNRNTLV